MILEDDMEAYERAAANKAANGNRSKAGSWKVLPD